MVIRSEETSDEEGSDDTEPDCKFWRFGVVIGNSVEEF